MFVNNLYDSDRVFIRGRVRLGDAGIMEHKRLPGGSDCINPLYNNPGTSTREKGGEVLAGGEREC